MAYARKEHGGPRNENLVFDRSSGRTGNWLANKAKIKDATSTFIAMTSGFFPAHVGRSSNVVHARAVLYIARPSIKMSRRADSPEGTFANAIKRDRVRAANYRRLVSAGLDFPRSDRRETAADRRRLANSENGRPLALESRVNIARIQMRSFIIYFHVARDTY